MPLINLRVKTEDHDRWKKAAGARGLSKMIREVVEEHVARVGVAALDPAIPDPIAEQDLVRAEKRKQVEGLRRLLEARSIPAAPRPAPRSAAGRVCEDHPDLQNNGVLCKYRGCDKKTR